MMGEKAVPEIPLCRDCARVRVGWFAKLVGNYNNAKCLTRTNTKTNPVSGKVTVEKEYVSCRDERMYSSSSCGRDGKRWEPANTKAATFMLLKR